MLDSIVCTLEEIFSNRTGLDFQSNDNIKGKEIFSIDLDIPVRELVLIFFDIENKFNIIIDQKYIDLGLNYTFNDILNIVQNELHDQ